MILALAALLGAPTAAAAAPPSSVPAPPAAPVAPAAKMLGKRSGAAPEYQPAALDQLLAAHDYAELSRRTAAASRWDDVEADLDWLQTRMVEGNSAILPILYARLLWAASANADPDQKSQLRQTAAMATIYAIMAIRIDGARCGDLSAPSHRLDQVLAMNPELTSFLRSLTDAERARIARAVVLTEKITAARRDAHGDVDFLCRGGMEEMSYNLSHGTQKEVPTPQGGIGRTIEVSGDGKFKPSLRPEAEWRPAAGRARASLAADVANLVGASASPAPQPK